METSVLSPGEATSPEKGPMAKENTGVLQGLVLVCVGGEGGNVSFQGAATPPEGGPLAKKT